MKKNIINFLTYVGIIGITSFVSQAQNDSTNVDETSTLLEISLEELMGITVTSASKKSEGMFDAPSIMATVTSKEISDFGARNVYEILERAASFYGIYSYFFPQNSIALRGDISTQTNQNILFLINGRPVRA